MQRSSSFFRLLAWYVALVTGCAWALPLAHAQQSTLAIYHIDVGQGDATLIVSPSGQTLLVDAGNNGMGTRFVVPLLSKLGLTALTYLIATHYDADHIGGIDEVVRALGGSHKVGTAFDRGSAHRDNPSENTNTYNDYVEAIGDKRKTVVPGTSIDLGSGITVRILSSNGVALGGKQFALGPNDENDASVSFILRYKGFDYFLGGDLTGGGRSGTKKTKDMESLVAPHAGDVDVLKVNHHGSLTSSNEPFLTMLQPEVAIISVGNGGSNSSRYRHPSRVVLDRLLSLRGLESIFQTKQGETIGGLTPTDRRTIQIVDGDVVLTTDGTVYHVNGKMFRVDQRQ